MDALESERKRLRKGVQHTCVVRLPANILAPTRPSHEQKARVTCEMAEAFAEERERERDTTQPQYQPRHTCSPDRGRV